MRAILLLSFAVLLGCQKPGDSSSNHGTVALIDLDVIARKLERGSEMAAAIQQREASLNAQLATVQASYTTQISEQRERFGQEPTQQQAQQLVELQRQATSDLQQRQQVVQASLNQQVSQVVGKFRDDVRVVARQVAREQGLSIIVTNNEEVVFAYEKAIDITDEVVKRMK